MSDDRPTNLRVEFIEEVTVNTGNFQNVKPGYRVSADVPEGTHPTAVRNKLKALVESWLEEDINDIRADLKGIYTGGQ